MIKKIFLLITLVLTLNTSFVQAKEVKFIFLTGADVNPQNAYKLRETVKEINAYKDVDFVVFGGNNLQKPNIDNLNYFLYLFKRVHKKSYVLLGNQDVLSTTGVNKKYYFKRVRRASFFRHSSKPNYVFKVKNCVFVAMDGSKQYFQSSNGYYSKEELMWLDKILSKYKDENIVILQHFPLLETKSQWLQTAKIEDYAEILAKHKNVKLIVSGHYNSNLEVETFGIKHILVENYSKNEAYKIIQLDLDENFIGTYLVK